MLSALVSVLLLGALTSAAPIADVEERSGNGCNADNVLRLFRAPERLGDTLPFCSDFLGMPKITEYADFVPTASETIIAYATVTQTVEWSETVTKVNFNKRAISTPVYIGSATIPESRISSACNCLTIPLATTTLGPQGITTFYGSKTETDVVYNVQTVTVTVTAPSLALASPTSVADFPVNEPAAFDQDDVNYRIELPFEVELYNFKSNLIFVSVNGLLWLDEFAYGDYVNYYTDSRNTFPLPASADILPDIAILPFWSDLIVTGGKVQGIWYQISGSSGSRQVTFEYRVAHVDDPAANYHFLVTFKENAPNKVVFDYRSVALSTQGTVAIQHRSGNKALTFSRRSNNLSAGKVLTFDTVANTISQ